MRKIFNIRQKLPVLIGLAGCLFLLSACGFDPLYATDPGNRESVGVVAAHMREIDIQPIRDRQGQIMYTRLKTRIPDSHGRLYKLEFDINSGESGSIVEQNTAISRFETVMSVRYRLINKQNGKELAKKNLTSRASFNAPRDPFAQLTAREDSQKRAALELADKVYLHLSVFFEQALAKKARQ